MALLVALSHILVQVGSVLLVYINLLKLETWTKGYYILTAWRPYDMINILKWKVLKLSVLNLLSEMEYGYGLYCHNNDGPY